MLKISLDIWAVLWYNIHKLKGGENMWMEMSYNKYQDNLSMWQRFEDDYNCADEAFDIFDEEEEDEDCL